jgi:hypothetical protein
LFLNKINHNSAYCALPGDASGTVASQIVAYLVLQESLGDPMGILKIITNRSRSRSFRAACLLLTFVIAGVAYSAGAYVAKPVPNISLEKNYQQADFVGVVSRVESVDVASREGYSHTICEVHWVIKDLPQAENKNSPRRIRILHRTKGDGKGGGSSRMVFDIDGINHAWSLVFLVWDKSEDAFVPLTGQDDAAYSQLIMLRPRDPLPH